jgi:D-alanine-D-alanine ligase
MNLISLTPNDARKLGKIAVLMGGTSAEREISILSGTGVLAALKAGGFDAHAFDPKVRPMEDLKREGFTRCFIALHGRHGEDGCIQGALELLGIPYTGPGPMASAISMNKVMTKRVWRAEVLPTPRGRVLSPEEQVDKYMSKVPDELGLPLIVKPPHEGSSVGVTKVKGWSQMKEAVDLAAGYDVDVLCEEFIDGDEVTVAVLGEGMDTMALPVVRIVAPDGQYDLQNKYFTDVVKYHCPSGLPDVEEKAVQRLAVAAYRALGCRGWSRADLIIRTSDRKPFLIEMNTSPGMTTHSLVPMAARAVGVSYEALCAHLIASAALDPRGKGGKPAKNEQPS